MASANWKKLLAKGGASSSDPIPGVSSSSVQASGKQRQEKQAQVDIDAAVKKALALDRAQSLQLQQEPTSSSSSRSSAAAVSSDSDAEESDEDASDDECDDIFDAPESIQNLQSSRSTGNSRPILRNGTTLGSRDAGSTFLYDASGGLDLNCDDGPFTAVARSALAAAGSASRQPNTIKEWFAALDGHRTVNSERAAQSGRFVAIDCEMVELADGRDALARLTLVNYHGCVLTDVYVRPDERIVDFRTAVSGIEPRHLAPESGAITLREAQQAFAEHVKPATVLVGHALHNDLNVLMMPHTKRNQRDTSTCGILRLRRAGGTRKAGARRSALRKLALAHLNLKIQGETGEQDPESAKTQETDKELLKDTRKKCRSFGTGAPHDSVIDAQVTMLLYRIARRDWESKLNVRQGGSAGKKSDQNNSESNGFELKSAPSVGSEDQPVTPRRLQKTPLKKSNVRKRFGAGKQRGSKTHRSKKLK